MHFCVFSFNRGRFLRNCLESIERCCPDARVTVFDDGSDDAETREVLAEAARSHRVETPGKRSSHRLGGLYGNMQSALDLLGEEETLCFLQDDTQIVRPLSDADRQEIEAAFSASPQLGFISPCFIRGRALKRGARFEFDDGLGLYFREPDERSSGCHFSALLITKPARLREVDWHFRGSEPDNDRQAAQLFGRIGYLHAPFAMWLPEVPAYRGKKKTLGLRLAEKKRGCGFYPFEILGDEEARSLRERDPSILPRAEDFLRCSPHEPPKPWAYNPLTDTGWIKLLNQIEVAIRKVFAKVKKPS